MSLYKILRHIGKVSYELDLSLELPSVPLIFYVSLLRKCIGNPSSIMSLESVSVEENLTYEEVSVEILDPQVRKLRNKEASVVKVQ